MSVGYVHQRSRSYEEAIRRGTELTPSEAVKVSDVAEVPRLDRAVRYLNQFASAAEAAAADE